MEKSRSQLKILMAKRDQFMTRIKNAFDLIPSLNEEQHREAFLIRCRTIPETKAQLELLIEQINSLAMEVDPKSVPDFSALNEIDDMFCAIESAKAGLTSLAVPDVSGPGRCRLKLPKLELASFSGNPLEWPIFYENFRTSVHENPGLSNAERVQYLVGKVTGKALNAIAGLPATAENYEVMWKKLVDDFQDQRKISTVYLTKMFNFRTSSNQLSNIEAFLDHFVPAYEALSHLPISNLADCMALHLASLKIDRETFQEFEMTDAVRQLDFPRFSEFVKYLKEKVRVMERTRRPSSNSASKSPHSHTFLVQGRDSSKHSHKCALCTREFHPLYRCQRFLNMLPPERAAYARKEDLCLNCLSNVHRLPQCKSESTCKKCHKRHNSLLHVEEITPSVPNAGVSLCSAKKSEGSVLLSTAVVKAFGQGERGRNIRVLLDSASQPNLISLSCAKSLGLRIEKVFSSVQGIGDAPTKIVGKTHLSFGPHFSSTPKYNLDFYVVSKIADKIPSRPVDVSQLTHLQNLILADSGFASPGEIDAIVGAELYSSLLKTSKVVDTQGSCTAVDTELGYVVMGKAPAVGSKPSSDDTFCFFQSEPLETLVSKFWALESINGGEELSDEERACENIFRETHRRDDQGRYIVSLPFQNSPCFLGDSWQVAERRFRHLERKFSRDPEFHKTYTGEILKLIENNYIAPNDSKEGYFIPHHAVVKAESSSTPLRIVFDASAKTDTGVSLNDILFAGPKLQTDTFAVLLRFRLFSIAISADVRQMYLRILLNPKHRKFQKLIWRFHPEEPLRIYEWTRVVFGVKSSPFLALRTIQQLATDEKNRFPLATQYIPSDMYVDDLVTSIPEVNESISLFNESIALFNAGGFELVKWSTNNESLFNHIPAESRKSSSVSLDPERKCKILGLVWDSQTDSFSFNLQPRSADCTKRNVLSTVARIFDPLGFLGPFLFYIKCLIKELWELKLDWDDRPPAEFEKRWQNLLTQIPSVSKIMIPRHVAADGDASTILVGFCDGSQRGYGAVVYLRSSMPNGNVKISLLAAKSRVSPTSKPFTIPQCELSSAWLLSRLLKAVTESISLRVKVSRVFAFSDSTITLGRIKSNKLSTEVFVRNRVAKIHEDVSPTNWFYISTAHNPADCLSRGLLPDELINHPLWWSGPHWLSHDVAEWPLTHSVDIAIPEEESQGHSLLVMEEDHPIFALADRCSTWRKFSHATVFVLRFCKKLTSKGQIVQPEEAEFAENYIFRIIQRRHFSTDISNLKAGKTCSRHIQNLQPFLDNELVRVGGRLRAADLSFHQKHPLLLPKSERIVELLVQHYHIKFLHAGPHLLLSLLRQKFWILSGRSVIRKVFRKCLQCFKANPRPSHPPMADLPSARVTPSPPFTHTGVDYAGPFLVTLKRGRGQKTHKSYVCLFVCLCTKALHLELAPDLSTQSFLNVLKRFLSRRGRCQVLYSDQGKNFVGAKAQLDEIFEIMESKEVQSHLADQRILWKFNPPAAPHFGGLWEANVGSVKSHLKRVVGSQILSTDEFQTILTQIEAILNSRPLTVMSDHPAEPLPLTPAHFLTSRPLVGLPATPAPDAPLNRISRPQLLDAMVQHFWRRWSREYLNTLQQRQKWLSRCEKIVPGTLVLLGTDGLPPLHWPLGIVDEIFPGDDGVVRVVQVRTDKGSYRRPVAKLYPLPTQN